MLWRLAGTGSHRSTTEHYRTICSAVSLGILTAVSLSLSPSLAASTPIDYFREWCAIQSVGKRVEGKDKVVECDSKEK